MRTRKSDFSGRSGLKQYIVNSIKTRHIIGHCLWVQLENQPNDYSKLGMSLAIGGE